ncbi:SPOSA6832_03420 [Sporobolomyces salmonicolor]|uniref:SPOSA6832_03420-mRNA-1:cds n=1 Tax=Sporidiobolus salmonicolor TaxID=5005 RepID=A0A0D6EPB5_SPOSA|nr:SPOSA6832_03420 [Sporobolomyces salmonicolor]
MSDTQPAPRPVAPPTAQEIERKLSSPTVAPPTPTLPSALDQGDAQRRYSSASRKAHGSQSEEDDAFPSPSRSNIPLAAISETEDAVLSGSESDASSDGERRSPRIAPPMLEPIRTSRDSAGLSDSVALKGGYLMKKGERRKAWKKRWFVLRGGQLAMYKNDKARLLSLASEHLSQEYQLLRLIPISDIHTAAPVELKKHSHTFGIVTPKRTYYVKADSDADMREWCQLVDRAKADYKAAATMTSIDTPTPVDSPTPLGPSPGQTPLAYATPSTSAIPIPPSSASHSGGGFAPHSYATTPSTSFTSPSIIASSYASTSASGGAPQLYAPPNSLVGGFPMTTGPSTGGLGLELQGLDAGLERMALADQQPPPPQLQQGRSMSSGSESLAPPAFGRGRSGSLGGKRRTWRKRWFVLMSGMLMYSRSHMDTKIHRQIPLSAILDAIEYDPSTSQPPKRPTIALPTNPVSPGGHDGERNYEHCFKIITPKRTYLVCAPSEEDEIKWLAALQCLVKRKSSQGATAGAAAMSAMPASNQSTARPGGGGGAEHAPYLARTPSQQQRQAQDDPLASSASLPPQVRPPAMHARQRSVTDAARQAVRDVERRFHPPPQGGGQGVRA